MAVVRAHDPETLRRQRLRDADRLHHLHSFTDHAQLAQTGAFIVERAEGCEIAGEGGITLLDAVAGLGCVNVGYGRSELAGAAARAIERLSYYPTFQAVTNPAAAELAERIAELAPGSLERVFFANSGSEANETIVKLVRAYWRAKGQGERRIVIGRDYGYHGSTLYTAGLSGLAHMHETFSLPLADTAHIMAPYWYREAEAGETPEDFGRRAAQALAAKIEALGPEHVAAFIAEPVQVTGGVIVPPETYWPEIVRVCRDAGILLVADEVVTGFGRTGEWFAQSAFDFEADLMTCAKGLSSACMPIAAAVASEKVADTVLSGGVFQHGFTTSGHPAACAVALENLAILEREGLVAQAGVRGRYLMERLAPLGGHPLIGEIRGSGLLAGIEIVRDKAMRSLYPIEQGVCAQVANTALLRGVIVRPTGNSIVLCPPFVVSEDEIDRIVAALSVALDEVSEKLGH